LGAEAVCSEVDGAGAGEDADEGLSSWYSMFKRPLEVFTLRTPSLLRMKMIPTRMATTTSVAKKLPVVTKVTTENKTRITAIIMNIPPVFITVEEDAVDDSLTGAVAGAGPVAPVLPGTLEDVSVCSIEDSAPDKDERSVLPVEVDVGGAVEPDALINSQGDNKTTNASFLTEEIL